jgi:hypothetical protein
VHSKAKCFSLERSREVEEARQEVKEHGQKTALCNGVKYFFKEHSYLYFHGFLQHFHIKIILWKYKKQMKIT